LEKAEWLQQARKGLLEYAMLAIIRNNPIFGHEITVSLEQTEFLAIDKVIAYNTLRKLEKNGLVTSLWKGPTEGARPRRFYSLTEYGKETLNMMDEEWQKMSAAIRRINTT
jgi:PadR family transcriptional regulator PadR